MVDSTDFAQVMSEAEDIAQSVNQRLTTAHVLLAMFTVENRAALLLKERGIDEDVLLELLTSAPSEPDGLIKELREKTREIATSCGSTEADCLHLLIATDPGALRGAGPAVQDRARSDGPAQHRAVVLHLGPHAAAPDAAARAAARRARARPPAAPLGAPPLPFAPPSRTAVVPPPPKPERTADPQGPRPGRDDVERRGDSPEPQPRGARRRAAARRAAAAAERPRRCRSPRPRPRRAARDEWTLDARTFPMLTSLGQNLTALAKDKKLDPVVGRAREIDEVIDILGKRRTNNPCLVGEPGVGKTAVVEGVAQQLASAARPAWASASSSSWTWPRWWPARSCAARSPSASTRVKDEVKQGRRAGWWCSSTRSTR